MKAPEEAADLAAAYGRFLLENGGQEAGEIPGAPDSKIYKVFDTYEVVLHRGKFLAGTHEADNHGKRNGCRITGLPQTGRGRAMSKQIKDHPPQSDMNRRDFLIRSAKAGIALGAAAAIGYLLYDPAGPGAPVEKSSVALPDFSVPEAGKKIAIATGEDRIKTVNAALKALGGIECFVKKGDRVLIKVNAAFATPPSLCATTNPELLAEVDAPVLQGGRGGSRRHRQFDQQSGKLFCA